MEITVSDRKDSSVWSSNKLVGQVEGRARTILAETVGICFSWEASPAFVVLVFFLLEADTSKVRCVGRGLDWSQTV